MDRFDWRELEEPPFSNHCWDEIQRGVENPEHVPLETCAYESIPVAKGMRAGLRGTAPEVSDFLESMNVGLHPITLTAASYYVAKAGIEALMRNSASVGGQYNIRVNCIRPGQVITPGATGGGTDHVFKTLFDMFQILDGPGYPIDVANLVLFLCSDEARFITGEIVNIDGGTPRKL
jgi:NAD(P)-dependent dehydrogenase (short-subunit alcohol dehydrogenase family)